MDLGLEEKVAVVTGGTEGIGRAEAEVLAKEGCRVVIVARHEGAGEEAAEEMKGRGLEVLFLQGDVSRGEDVRRVMAEVLRRFGRLDILVNNAGVTGPELNKPLVDLDEALWETMIDSHLKSVFLCTKHAAPAMIARRWGRIINTSSVHGRVGGRPTLGHYGAAKAGVIALTKTAARELGPQGITANAIAPGFIRTARLEKILSPETLDRLKGQIPLRRMGETAEVGRVVAFLASEAASYVNGAVIDLNGGRWEYAF